MVRNIGVIALLIILVITVCFLPFAPVHKAHTGVDHSLAEIHQTAFPSAALLTKGKTKSNIVPVPLFVLLFLLYTFLAVIPLFSFHCSHLRVFISLYFFTETTEASYAN